MKILLLTPYIYAPLYKEHAINKSGFGIMVYDIASALGKAGNDVTVLAHAFGKTRECDGFRILKNTAFKNIIHGCYKGKFKLNSKLKSYGVSFKGRLKNCYYHLNLGYIKHTVKALKPDVVHIHGCSTFADELMAFLRKQNVPFVLTLHGLLQDDHSVNATKYSKENEIAVIRKSYDEKIPITVIGSKMKERFTSDYYGAKSNENVYVVTNGVNVAKYEQTYSIYEKYNIDRQKNIIMTVGSVCKLKNQMQTLRAFSMLSEDIKENSVLMFVGNIISSYPISEEIEKLGLQDKVICTGFVPREELKNYYSSVKLTVTASETEGFGLPMIESFVYGVPCVAFADLDAIPDIYSSDAMLLCEERSDKALSEKISLALKVSWDKEKIEAHSNNFSLESMAEKYEDVLKKAIEDN